MVEIMVGIPVRTLRVNIIDDVLEPADGGEVVAEGW